MTAKFILAPFTGQARYEILVPSAEVTKPPAERVASAAKVTEATQDFEGFLLGLQGAAIEPGGPIGRFGVNLMMYALTGNYKTDQVHAPALLQRLGR